MSGVLSAGSRYAGCSPQYTRKGGRAGMCNTSGGLTALLGKRGVGASGRPSQHGALLMRRGFGLRLLRAQRAAQVGAGHSRRVAWLMGRGFDSDLSRAQRATRRSWAIAGVNVSGGQKQRISLARCDLRRRRRHPARRPALRARRPGPACSSYPRHICVTGDPTGRPHDRHAVSQSTADLCWGYHCSVEF